MNLAFLSLHAREYTTTAIHDTRLDLQFKGGRFQEPLLIITIIIIIIIIIQVSESNKIKRGLTWLTMQLVEGKALKLEVKS